MLNYPSGIKSKKAQSAVNTNHASRGMFLETILNQTNDYYRLKQLAVIHKKPTPIQVVSVSYPKRSAAVITEAYYRQASTTDYNGVYQGFYIDFEAKETRNKTSFPLRNIHQHQLEHMQACMEQGGITFFIFYFSSLKQFFVLEANYVIDFITYHKNSAIPLAYIQEHGMEVYLTVQSILDYIPAVQSIIRDKL